MTNRLRRASEDPLDEQPIESETTEEEQPRRTDPRVVVGIGAFILGCIVLIGCMAAYSYGRGLFGESEPIPVAQPTNRIVTFTPTGVQLNAPTPATEVIVQPTEDLTATAASLPSVRYATLTEIVGAVQIRAGADGVWTPVAADTVIAPGTTVLTAQESRVKVTLSEGSIIRLSSQTQFTLIEASGADTDPVSLMQLDFGKVWAIVVAPLGAGRFEIQLPYGSASVRGSFMSAEYNSTTDGIVVTCLEGSCHYENANGAVDLITNQQTVSTKGVAPSAPRPISRNQFADWTAQNVPEVMTLTPTAPPSNTPTETFTPIPSRTPIPSKTPRPSRTPIPSKTPTGTKPPSNTPTPSLTATLTGTPTETATVGPSPTPGTPAKLAFVVQPKSSPVGVAMEVQVAIQDANGIAVTNATDSVSLTIGSNTGGGTLAGVTTVGAVNGVAVFRVSIDKPGSYTLVATSGSLASATSAAFDVTGSTANYLIITGLSSDVTVTAGQPVTITVTAIEVSGNVSTDYLGTIAFQSSDAQALLPANYAFTPNDRGSHAFNVTFKTIGTQSLKVFDLNVPDLAGYAGTTVK